MQVYYKKLVYHWKCQNMQPASGETRESQWCRSNPKSGRLNTLAVLVFQFESRSWERLMSQPKAVRWEGSLILMRGPAFLFCSELQLIE